MRRIDNTLLADDGMWITQSDEKIVEGRMFTPIVSLGCNDSEDKYQEVTDEWKQNWEEEHPQHEPELEQ